MKNQLLKILTLFISFSFLLSCTNHTIDDISEEEEIIGPAIKRARDEGFHVTGPFPADTLFHKAASGQFDAVVAMYHDQGLIPLKLLHFSDAVNVTLGLPIIRTSVDHGTAYDIAGTGQADGSSLKEAIKLAAVMVKSRRQT